MPEYKNLFLRQSYLDQSEQYERILAEELPTWDYVVITASNEIQAESYRHQIDFRLTNGRLPKNSKYLVVPDLEGKRIGSGGATLNVLKKIAEDRKNCDFTGLKILLLHSGGDSKRIPQYSACGKLFSPVPRTLADGRRSTLFDEFMVGFCGVPARITDGAVFCSGDVLLLFNPLQIDFYSIGAAALSIKDSPETGKDHGVYLIDDNGNVGSFLHKYSVPELKKAGAVDQSGHIDIDTGSMIYDSHILNDLYSLIDTESKFRSLVNEKVRLSLYADFNYPMAGNSTLEEFYREPPEGEPCAELQAARTLVWRALHQYKMKMIRFSPAAFLHFGTTAELLKLMTEEIGDYRFLDWKPLINTNCRQTNIAVSNSYISPEARIGEGSYVEDSSVRNEVVVGKKCIISGVTLEGVSVPDGTVLHGLKLNDGNYVVRKYSVEDNPKNPLWMGMTLKEPLWTCPLFSEYPSIHEAVEASLTDSGEGEGHLSLKESFNQADVSEILPWQEKLDDRIKSGMLLEAIEAHVPAAEAVRLFSHGISARVQEHLLHYAAKLDENHLEEFKIKIRIYYYLSRMIDRKEMEDLCFNTICRSILAASMEGAEFNASCRIQKEEIITRLPVRVNFGGGWSDTPPYCLENGGTVMNAAITLNDHDPIEVTLRKIEKGKVILESTDIGSRKEFMDVRELQDCRSVSDAFALHKAALMACGVIPYKENIPLSEITERLGGGIYINTRVIGIPKGSGLGTSSILAGACVKGIFEFLGIEITENDLYNRVLCLEQLMSTGGGWQDQVGGLTPGFKIITSKPGIKQNIVCTPLLLTEKTIKELDRRFAVIYTGQRRLARNLLRDIIGKYIGNDPDVIHILDEIQKVSVQMRFELERDNVDSFARLLSEHWELSKQLDPGCSNTCIDQILNTIDDLVDGKMICGAGGGGFLQVVLKKDVTIEKMRNRLSDVFADSGVDVWKCNFLLGNE